MDMQKVATEEISILFAQLGDMREKVHIACKLETYKPTYSTYINVCGAGHLIEVQRKRVINNICKVSSSLKYLVSEEAEPVLKIGNILLSNYNSFYKDLSDAYSQLIEMCIGSEGVE